MSTTQSHALAAEGTIRCPRCQANVLPEQDWCLSCGAPARTRLAPSPNWRGPVVALATVAALSLVALILAFFALTSDDGSSKTTSTAAPSGQTGPTGVSGANGVVAP